MAEEKKKTITKKTTISKIAKPAVKAEKKPAVVKAVKKVVDEEKEATPKVAKASSRKEQYYEAVGRRKSAIARVRLSSKTIGLEVNGKPLDKYFTISRLAKKAYAPLDKIKIGDKVGGTVKVLGGGINAQADAVCLGVARALVIFNPEFKKRLRRLGYMTRDSRAVERKKPGLKKARRAPQWVKR